MCLPRIKAMPIVSFFLHQLFLTTRFQVRFFFTCLLNIDLYLIKCKRQPQ